ncbi:MAG: type I methionyl aminopeptidase [Lachnospiraceae bacterium]|nr:type I methionyl aminopeptidase [Lachnospiraceae bacterium]
MAITVKTESQIELMRAAGNILGRVHLELSKELKEGMSTKDIDVLGEEIIRSYGCEPSFLGYQGYPASVCVSVNEEVVHGIPSAKRIIKDGDIVSLDIGVIYKGFQSDAARTHGIGEISAKARRLIADTRESFFRGIEPAVAGNHLHDISNAINHYAVRHGYGVVRDLAGHGIGRNLHEDPIVPNYRQVKNGPLLKSGMTLAVEPMLNIGSYAVKWLDDGWTVVTADRTLSAHYENTILITEDGPEILSITDEELSSYGS